MTRHETLPTSNHIRIPVGTGAFMAEGRGPLRRMKRGPVPGLDYFAEKAVPAAGRYTRERGSGPGRKSVSTHRSPQGMIGRFGLSGLRRKSQRGARRPCVGRSLDAPSTRQGPDWLHVRHHDWSGPIAVRTKEPRDDA